MSSKPGTSSVPGNTTSSSSNSSSKGWSTQRSNTFETNYYARFGSK